MLPTMEQTQQEITAYYDSFYSEGDFTYYSPAVSRAALSAIMQKAGIATGARVLDVGCGTGFYSGLLQELGYEVTGVDVSTAAIEKARALHPGIRFEQADILEASEDFRGYDVVFAIGFSPLNTANMQNLHNVMNALLRLVNDNGILLFLGGSTLSGDATAPSNWHNHVWKDILSIAPEGSEVISGPWLTHFQLLRMLPSAIALSTPLTLLLRFLPLRFVRRIVLAIRPSPTASA
ncbi:methyltransferase domain-containing protein [bacterium]|nr:methyltransferase domain-containing protein [bacterium]